MDFVQASDFFESLKSDERVFLLIRHAERGHITPDDPDLGAHVGLTDKGRMQALSLGESIPAEGDMCFYSSPVGRCMETARCIAEGRALSDALVEPLDCLGDFFVQNDEEAMKVMRNGFYEGLCAWLDSEMAGKPRSGDEAFYPLSDRAEEMLSMMLEKGNARFNVFATHDAWVVPCLVHFCKMHFTPSCWMNYLTGMAVVTDAQKTVHRIVPVTGIDTGWLKF